MTVSLPIGGEVFVGLWGAARARSGAAAARIVASLAARTATLTALSNARVAAVECVEAVALRDGVRAIGAGSRAVAALVLAAVSPAAALTSGVSWALLLGVGVVLGLVVFGWSRG